MIIGVIAEGKSDQAVITNILSGIGGVDESSIKLIRPSDSYDETDLANLDPNSFGGWSLVKKDCEENVKFQNFFAIEGQDFMVIHIDTLESDQYGINRPSKDHKYCSELREAVITAINNWLQNKYIDKLLYAISVEEIEAWILTIYEKRNSAESADPKQKLKRVLNKIGKSSDETYDNYFELTKDFSNSKKVKRGKYFNYNDSLKLFFDEIKSKLNV